MPIDQVSVSLRKLGDPWTTPWVVPVSEMKTDPGTGERYAIREIDAVQVRVSVPPPMEDA